MTYWQSTVYIAARCPPGEGKISHLYASCSEGNVVWSVTAASQCMSVHALCAETTVFESSSDSGHFVLRKARAHAIITDRRLVPSLMPKEDLDKPQGPAVFILASDLAR